jgi:glutathione S-transferase
LTQLVRCRVVRLIDPDGFGQGVRLRQAAFEAFRMGQKRGLRGLSTRLEDSVGQAVVNRLRGEQFTVADAYLFTVLNWSNLFKVDLGKWPILKDYITHVAARPAVREAMRAEGLAE